MVESLTAGYLKRREQGREDAFTLWMRSPSTPQDADASPAGQKLRYVQMVEDMAPVYGVDPVMALAVIEQESAWNPRAVSKAGAQGLMQLMPATGRRFGVRDPFDPQENIRGGLRYLAYLNTLFPGETTKQLAAYNAGEGAVQKYGGVPPYPETQHYVARISRTMAGQAYVGKEEQKALSGQLGEQLATLPSQGERLESPAGAQARAMEQQLGGQPVPSAGVQEGTTVELQPGRIGPERQTMQPVSEAEAAIFEGAYTPPSAVEVEPGRLAEQARPLSPVLGPGLEPGLEEPLEGRLPARIGQGFVRAVAAVINAVPAFEKFVGIETPFGNTAQEVALALEGVAGAIEPPGTETGLVDRLAETAGGAVAFFGAGVGGTQALQFITAAAPKIVRAVGLTPAAISAVTEAGAEASQTYEALRPLVGDQQAASRANTVFWRNVWLLTVTNKLGIFGGAEKPLGRVLAGGAMEGVQEAMQYDVQRRAFWVPATHPQAAALAAQGWERAGNRVQQPFDVATATEAGVLGALMGGGMAGVAGEIGTPRQAGAAPAVTPAGETVPAPPPEAVAPAIPGPVPADVPAAVTAEAPAPRPEAAPAVTGAPEEAPALAQSQVRQGYGTEQPGALQRMYHGTTADFAQFVPGRADPDALFGPGMYFTDTPSVASGYAGAGTTGGNIRPVYLDIRRPFDLPFAEHPMDAALRPAITALAAQVPVGDSLRPPDVADYTNMDVYDLLAEHFQGDLRQVNTWLQQQGYDGITHEGGRLTGGTRHRVWIAFDPAQVIPAYSAAARPDLPPWKVTLGEMFSQAKQSLREETGAVQLPQFPQQPSPPRPVTLAEGAAGLEPSRFRDEQGRWRIPLKDMPAEELELQDFIRQQGGIRLTNEELQGELAALISRKETGITGLQNNVSGRSLQAMAERAQESGFIATADKTALLEALDRSVSQGIALYSVAASGYIPLVEDPTTRALYEQVVELSQTYQQRVETQRRGGVRPHQAVHAEASALLAGGQWSFEDVQEILPGTVLDDTTSSAMVQSLHMMGRLVQQKAQQFVESGAAMGSPEEQSFLQGLALFAETDPMRLGVMAESGRSLGILNEPLSEFNRFLNQFQPLLASMGEQSSLQLAKRIAALETPEQAAKTISHLTQPGLEDMILEVWINGMLSSPRTQMVNFVSNAMTAAWAIPERLIAGVYGSVLTGGEISPGEVTAQWWGLTQGIREGWKLAAQVVRTGERPAASTGTTKIETKYPKALTAQHLGIDPDSAFGHVFDFWAEYIGLGSGGRLPARGLLATDEFFRAVNYRMELAALTYRRARAEGLPPEARKQFMVDAATHPKAEDLRTAAQEFALLQTFQKELEPHSLGGRMQTLGGWSPSFPVLGALPVGRALLPFIRTPVNIARWATERTPFGPFYQEMRDDYAAGGARREVMLAKTTLGTLTMAAAAGLALSGVLTGRGPEDKHLRAALERTGWQPYSVKIGGTYLAYDRFDPVGLLLGMTADVTQLVGDQSNDLITRLIAGPAFAFMRNMTNKTYLQGLSRFFDAVSPQAFSEPEQWGEGVIRWVRSQAASLVPAAVATVTTAIDPWDRELWGWFDGALERTPFTQDNLPLKRDRWGFPKLLGWGFDDTWLTRLGRAVTPLTISQDLQSPIDEELGKQGIRLGMPSRSFLPTTDMLTEWRGDPLTAPPLTPAQYEQYVLYSAANVDELSRMGLTYPADRLRALTAAAGRGVRATPPQQAMPLVDVLDWVITTDTYQEQSEGPGGGRERIIRSIAVGYQEAARELMLERDPELRVRYEAAVKIRALQQAPPAKKEQAEERFEQGRQRWHERLGIGR